MNILEMAYQKGREDAIDEFVRKVAEYYTECERNEMYADLTRRIKQTIADFGECMKEQRNG